MLGNAAQVVWHEHNQILGHLGSGSVLPEQ